MAEHFDVAGLLALPLTPSIRVRIGPEEVLEIDQHVWEASKEEFSTWALGLPNVGQGICWRDLKPFTGQNGMLAKLVIALGDLAKIWRMYPSPDQPRLWGRTSPSILMLSTSPRKPQGGGGIPKPSAGELEPTKVCTCCEEGMGPPNSRIHDKTESDEASGICVECDLVCGTRASSCQLNQKSKKAEALPRPVDTRSEEQEHPSQIVNLRASAFEDYAKQFGDG